MKPQSHRITFSFDASSLVSQAQRGARGIVCHEVTVHDPVTGETRVLLVPAPQEPRYCGPGREGRYEYALSRNLR